MDTIKKDNIAGLFKSDIQYIIPLFQRRYVWEKDTQWKPLWEDIKKIANKRLTDKRRNAVAHFTGAIITQERRTGAGDVRVYEIIDGQQRLTTFQVILCALRNICGDCSDNVDLQKIKTDIGTYIANIGRNINADNEFKLVPTKYDRGHFKYLADSGRNLPEGFHDSRIKKAYDYFKGVMEKEVGNNPMMAEALLTAITGDFHIVQIDVDAKEGDEPEIIYQSLNGRMQELSQFDLLRNDLFLRMRQDENERKDDLYEQYWEHFDLPLSGWETVVDKNPLTEVFLQHFLVAKRGIAGVFPLFHHYQMYRTGLPSDANVETELKEIRKYADNYKHIANISHGNTEFHADIRNRMNVYGKDMLDITTFRPLVLFLLAQDYLPEKQIVHALKALESYMFRRYLCMEYWGNVFNMFCAEIIGKLISHGMFPKITIKWLLDLLSSNDGARRGANDARKWPGDQLVKETVCPVRYNSQFMRYILVEIEKFQTTKYQPTPNFSSNKLELEHILPVKWREHWALPGPQGPVKWHEILSAEYKKNHRNWENNCPNENDEGAALKDKSYAGALAVAKERDKLLHSLGNLTVVTPDFNKELSNRAWSEKKPLFEAHSNLLLDKEVAREETWDVQQIKDRAKRLHGIFCKIWPDAKWFLDNIPPA